MVLNTIRWVNPEGSLIPLVVVEVPAGWPARLSEATDELWRARKGFSRVLIAALGRRRWEEAEAVKPSEKKITLTGDEVRALEASWREVHTKLGQVRVCRDQLRHSLKLMGLGQATRETIEVPHWWLTQWGDLVSYTIAEALGLFAIFRIILDKDKIAEDGVLLLSHQQTQLLWAAVHGVGLWIGELLIKKADVLRFISGRAELADVAAGLADAGLVR